MLVVEVDGFAAEALQALLAGFLHVLRSAAETQPFTVGSPPSAELRRHGHPVGEQTLSFGPGECLLVSHDLPVRSRIIKAPYLALVLEVDVTTIRKLYDEVAESALDSERARAAETHRADPGLTAGRNERVVISPTLQDESPRRRRCSTKRSFACSRHGDS
jgi:hypothetical protein